MTRIVGSLAEVSDRYEAMFVDLWGCVHDGLRPLPGAVEALVAYRGRGGRVILVTNAPRPRDSIAAQLDAIGVAREAWDDIATSGDSARLALFRGAVGGRVWHLGPDHDAPFFEAPAILDDPIAVDRVALEAAEGIACTGPFDPLADPDVLRPQLLAAKVRGLKLLCANPDIVVDRGGVREWCAGAVARLYTRMGGESLYFGKPHPPIYDLARRRLTALGKSLSDPRIIAIGDGIGTDISGALQEDIDSLFISGGLAAAETKTTTDPDPQALTNYLQTEMTSPTFTIGQLR